MPSGLLKLNLGQKYEIILVAIKPFPQQLSSAASVPGQQPPHLISALQWLSSAPLSFLISDHTSYDVNHHFKIYP